jgi:hypothetical protein
MVENGDDDGNRKRAPRTPIVSENGDHGVKKNDCKRERE